MLLVIHCFGSGQVFLLSQLQLSVSVFCNWLFLIICALCLVIVDLTLFMQLWYHEQQKTRFQFNITVYSLNINHLTVLHSRKPKIRMLNVSCCFSVRPLTNISKYVMSAHILWVLHHPPPSL